MGSNDFNDDFEGSDLDDLNDMDISDESEYSSDEDDFSSDEESTEVISSGTRPASRNIGPAKRAATGATVKKPVNKQVTPAKPAKRAASTSQKQANTVLIDGMDKLKQSVSEEGDEDFLNNGKFGFKLYFYLMIECIAVIFGNLTVLLVLIAFVIMCEKRKDLTKAMLSILWLYCMVSATGYVIRDCLYVLHNFIPGWGFLVNVRNWLANLNSFISEIFAAVVDFIAILGIIKAKKGSYFKVKLIDKIFS